MDPSIRSEASALPIAEMHEYDASSVAGTLLATLPIASFLGQYLFSLRENTQALLLHHLTVTFVDWVFVPFNFFVVRVIDWTRGGRLFILMCISITLTTLTHAYWQYQGYDGGHMITSTGFILPAGWVHVIFSTIEMVLLLAFVFCRKRGVPRPLVVTVLAVVYFLSMGACGYVMHRGFIMSDVATTASGLFFVLAYPSLVHPSVSP